MIHAPVPDNEVARLSSLQSLFLLDTAAEEQYERITRIAQSVFNVDICAMSLLDANRQWFKSKQGTETCQTPRDISFCGHAVLQDDLLVVNDTHNDLRFFDNPLVTGEPHIRFYAGCPLRAPDSHKLGTLCLIDRCARSFDERDRQTLRDLGGVIEDEIRNSTRIVEDELTGLANRRGFTTVANQMLSLSRRTNLSVELLYFDIDNLKQINDTHGHRAGDQVIQQFAEMLSECFRTADVVARIGGDEFVVLLTASTLSSSEALSRLKQRASESQRHRIHNLSWSMGAVRFDSIRHDGVCALLQDADTMMYAHKNQRRSAANHRQNLHTSS